MNYVLWNTSISKKECETPNLTPPGLTSHHISAAVCSSFVEFKIEFDILTKKTQPIIFFFVIKTT